MGSSLAITEQDNRHCATITGLPPPPDLGL